MWFVWWPVDVLRQRWSGYHLSSDRSRTLCDIVVPEGSSSSRAQLNIPHLTVCSYCLKAYQERLPEAEDLVWEY